MTDAPGGRPPKDAEQIRRRLSAVHDSVPQRKTGGAADGLHPHERIVIAKFWNLDACRSFQHALSLAGVPSSVKTRRKRHYLSVDNEDRGVARRVWAAHAPDHPDIRPVGPLGDHDFLIFGMFIGGSLGLVPLLGILQAPSDVIIILGFALIGGLVGQLCDLMRQRFRRGVLLQIGLQEYLILVTIPALLLLMWRIIPVLVKR